MFSLYQSSIQSKKKTPSYINSPKTTGKPYSQKNGKKRTANRSKREFAGSSGNTLSPVDTIHQEFVYETHLTEMKKIKNAMREWSMKMNHISPFVPE